MAKNNLRLILLLILLFIIGFWFRGAAFPPVPSPACDQTGAEEVEVASGSSFLTFDPTKRVKVKVWQVVDGETFAISKYDRVRLLEVRSPSLSTEEGFKAMRFLQDLVEDKQVELQFVPEIALRDSYGHLMAIVWIDGVNVNSKMVQQGLAESMVIK